MKKYWIIFKNVLQSSFSYRVNTIAFFLSDGISLFVMIYLWASMYYYGNKIGNYSLSGLIIYYVISKFVNLIIKNDVARWVGDEIRNGEIIDYLVKPISYFGRILIDTIGTIFYNIIAYSGVLLVIIIYAFYKLPANYFNIMLFLLSVILGAAINFLIFYNIGISTFYFGFIMGFNSIMSNVVFFLSGGYIPLDLLPKWLFIITNYLPFKFVTFFPVSIIMGKLQVAEIYNSFFLGLIWVFVLYMLSVLIYKNGLKKYESFGI